MAEDKGNVTATQGTDAPAATGNAPAMVDPNTGDVGEAEAAPTVKIKTDAGDVIEVSRKAYDLYYRPAGVKEYKGK